MAKVMTSADFCGGAAETSMPNPAINPFSAGFFGRSTPKKILSVPPMRLFISLRYRFTGMPRLARYSFICFIV